MALCKIVKAPSSNRGYFVTTTKNTLIPQRTTLEEIIINLASALGIEIIHKQESSRNAYFYEVQGKGFGGYQSATNTILELSRKLANNPIPNLPAQGD